MVAAADSIARCKWRCPTKGCFCNLRLNAKGRQSRRHKKKGVVPPLFKLTKDYLIELYEKQNGIGFYSRVPLVIQPLSDWQVSLERLNPEEDYVHGNIVLEALEFNCGSQWSLKKVHEIPELISAQSNISLLDLEIAKKRPKLRAGQNKPQHMHDQYFCHYCNQWFSESDFYISKRTRCIKCVAISKHDHRNTLRGYLQNIISNSHSNGLKRKSSDDDTRHVCTITFDDLLELLKEQKFRCYYSRIPMRFKTNSDWRCSLERLDNMKGYTKENCVLICLEFNSTDNTAFAKFQVFGSAQWSREKFLYFYKIRFGREPPDAES